MKKLIASLLALTLLLCGASLAENPESDFTYFPESEAYVGTWIYGDYTLEIAHNETDYNVYDCVVTHFAGDGEGEQWVYEGCSYDDISEALSCEMVGVMSTVRVDDDMNVISSEIVFDDGATAFRLDDQNNVVWTNFKEASGMDTLAFTRANEASDGSDAADDGMDQILLGEWLEAETQFTQMTIEKNPTEGWDVEIASPLTHGAYIFKTTIQYDADQQCFTYNKDKFWDVPITEEETPELGEAKIAGTIGTFTWDDQKMILTWVDDSQPDQEVRFERTETIETEATVAANGDAVYGYLGDETVEEQVVFDTEGVKITVTGLEIVRYAPVLELRVENASGRRLGFSLTESALNGWMWDASLCTYEKNGGDPDDDVYNEEIDLFVEDGETLDCGLGFTNEYYYEPCGITGFGEIGFALSAYDPDNGDVVFTTPVINVETSLGADIPGLYRDVGTLAYEANDLRIVIVGLNSDEYRTNVQVYINNYSDVPVVISAESCSVNDVETEAWFGAQVSPGRQCLAEMGFDDITEISKLAVAFRVEEYTLEYTENPAVIGVSDVVEVEF